MTTPESDPYADQGESDWQVRPAVPGWSVGQDFLTGPIFDDTGWHIDLSNVDWAGSRADQRRGEDRDPDGYGPPGTAPRYYRRDRRARTDETAYTGPHPPGERTAAFAPEPGRRAWPEPEAAWAEPETAESPDRRLGRHRRHVESEDELAGRPGRRSGPGAQPRPVQPRRTTSRPSPERPDEPGYQPPGRQPDGYDARGYERPRSGPAGYQRPGYDAAADYAAPAGFDGRPGYVQPDYAEPRYAQAGYAGPGYAEPGYAEPGYAEPGYAEPGYAEPGYEPPRTLPTPPPAGAPRVGPRPARTRPGARPSELLGEPGAGRPRTAGPFLDDPRSGGIGLASPSAPAERGSASIVRSSGVMAVGTLGSRLTGFLRTVVQSAALGAAGIAAAYNLSNTLPNVVYNLALGGILTSVIVPLIVNAAKRDFSRSSGYDQRMFTLVTGALAAITLLAMIAAVPIVHLYAGSKIAGSPPTLHLAIIFALFFIPQIFFYGISSLIGAILNSRGIFAAPMWTPIVNNLVVIAFLGLYVAVAGIHKTPGTISGSEVELLGIGTTLGIVAQTVALVPALRRVGFRWRPRTDFRRGEVAEIGRMAGWMFCYIGATQVAFLVTTKIAGDASVAGITQYNYAWLLFQLPYAVVGISVITALLPRMSFHAADRRYGLVRQDFSAGVRLAAAIVVPCSLVLAALGPKLAELFLGYGAMGAADARYTGVVFSIFCLGLLPYMIFQLQLRVFYALHDSRTPALIGLVTMTVNIVANVIALHEGRNVVAGLGVGFGLANVVGMVVAWRILTRRLRGLDGYLIGRSLVRMHAAALPAALIAVLVGIITGNAVIDVLIGGGLAVVMYVLFARALRIDEVTGLTRMVMSRLGR
jgi:putative peptidoglycan lipid II flippase